MSEEVGSAGEQLGWRVEMSARNAFASPPSASYSVASVQLRGIRDLRGALIGLTNRVPGRTYASGITRTEEIWIDDAPSRLEEARMTAGLWPASYEIRRYASSGSNVVADALQFTSPAEAWRFLAAAASVRCHRDGHASRAALPAGAHDLVWLNPDTYTLQDAFMQRGNLVYRVGAVTSARSGPTPPQEQRRAIASVNQLACSLPRAGC